MTEVADTVFLFDVDNTLLDNDRIQADLGTHLVRHTMAGKSATVSGRSSRTLRSELGYADYLGALERYRLEAMHHPKVLRIANWLVDYPFHDRLYPNAIAVVKAAQLVGISGHSFRR